MESLQQRAERLGGIPEIASELLVSYTGGTRAPSSVVAGRRKITDGTTVPHRYEHVAMDTAALRLGSLLGRYLSAWHARFATTVLVQLVDDVAMCTEVTSDPFDGGEGTILTGTEVAIRALSLLRDDGVVHGRLGAATFARSDGRYVVTHPRVIRRVTPTARAVGLGLLGYASGQQAECSSAIQGLIAVGLSAELSEQVVQSLQGRLSRIAEVFARGVPRIQKPPLSAPRVPDPLATVMVTLDLVAMEGFLQTDG